MNKALLFKRSGEPLNVYTCIASAAHSKRYTKRIYIIRLMQICKRFANEMWQEQQHCCTYSFFWWNKITLRKRGARERQKKVETNSILCIACQCNKCTHTHAHAHAYIALECMPKMRLSVYYYCWCCCFKTFIPRIIMMMEMQILWEERKKTHNEKME